MTTPEHFRPRLQTPEANWGEPGSGERLPDQLFWQICEAIEDKLDTEETYSLTQRAIWAPDDAPHGTTWMRPLTEKGASLGNIKVVGDNTGIIPGIYVAAPGVTFEDGTPTVDHFSVHDMTLGGEYRPRISVETRVTDRRNGGYYGGVVEISTVYDADSPMARVDRLKGLLDILQRAD